MARHGENIRKRIDGRWEARYRVFDFEKGRKTYRSVYGSTYEEAKDKRTDAIRKIGKNSDSATGQTPQSEDRPCPQFLFSQVADQWLKKIFSKRKYSTYIKYRNIYRIHLEEILGSYPLSDIPCRDIQKKISDHLSAENISDSIRKSVCCVANQILKFAGRKYSVYVPALKTTDINTVKKPVETFTKDEQSRLLSCIYDSPDKFKIALLFCLYTGMRLGELCALKWTDIDFKEEIVTVNKTVQRIAVEGFRRKTTLMETDPKSKSSKRTIPLAAEIMRLLESLKQERENQSYLFGEDRPMDPRTMQYRFKRILGEADIDSRNFHILRHTFATNCVESGMDVKTLSVILGHSDVKITMNRYVHPTMDFKKKQIDRLPDFYGRIRGQAA